MKLLALLFALAGCAEMAPTNVPVGPAHWDRERTAYDVFRRRIHAIAVNSSNAPVVLDCSDMRRVIPPRTEVCVLVFLGEHYDLQPRITYQTAVEALTQDQGASP